eukprot:6078584-Amphidinium_carterae.2
MPFRVDSKTTDDCAVRRHWSGFVRVCARKTSPRDRPPVVKAQKRAGANWWCKMLRASVMSVADVDASMPRGNNAVAASHTSSRVVHWVESLSRTHRHAIYSHTRLTTV